MAVVRRLTERFSEEEFAQLLDAEAQRVSELYAEGVIRTIWSRRDVLGAVIIFESEVEAAARAAFSTLPLAQRGMLEAQFIPLRAYRGFCP